ncbi:MarR family winged helix-turn-helix transcriptional regulator [Amycolatopsis sp. CA-230715]|uniref:MarR family winged helix-turn-helix transcriptional regulator n=1 Tax=Amycolatopsis sp. CA-230715 TaxID=2745196 RepID=UPI001C332551|nr:MarR family transcriptional regulator [Amycolatopsis sp. CA-230715]QWF84172.1 hypothetical protein HUW46_07616 [Amycolatopsis sp. CA-230715]
MTGGTKQRLIDELMLVVTDLQNVGDQVDQAVSDRLELNRTDARCLSCLITRGPMASGDLATTAGLAPSALTFAVDRLTRAGYAERVRDPADRRRVLVKASATALQFAERTWSEVIVETEQQFARYTVSQLKLLTAFVHDQIELQRRHITRVRSS